MWLYKLNFGTFSGIQPVKSEIPEFQFKDRDGKAITHQDFVGKYTILDFWNTGCGICFREFPKFEELYVKYQSNNDVAIYAVNVKLSRDKEGISFDIISEKGYSFPTLQYGQIEEAKDVFGVTVYPTVLVLDQTGAIVFRGDMEKAFSFVDSKLEKK